MSRSRKKQPVTSVTTETSEKQDKRLANRVLRRNTRRQLGKDPEEAVLPEMREVSDPWMMGKDGKHRFDPEHYPKGMRK